MTQGGPGLGTPHPGLYPGPGRGEWAQASYTDSVRGPHSAPSVPHSGPRLPAEAVSRANTDMSTVRRGIPADDAVGVDQGTVPSTDEQCSEPEAAH